MVEEVLKLIELAAALEGKAAELEWHKGVIEGTYTVQLGDVSVEMSQWPSKGIPRGYKLVLHDVEIRRNSGELLVGSHQDPGFDHLRRIFEAADNQFGDPVETANKALEYLRSDHV